MPEAVTEGVLVRPVGALPDFPDVRVTLTNTRVKDAHLRRADATTTARAAKQQWQYQQHQILSQEGGDHGNNL